MILRVAGRTLRGPVVDLRATPVDADGLDPGAVAAAIRGERSPHVAVCPPAGPVHRRVGCVRPGMGLRARTALAAAARSRGHEAPQDGEIAALREEIRGLADETSVDRRAAGAADADRERLRERVAELRGRVRTLEDCGRDAADARERLRDVARRLSELETERVAAVQGRDRVRSIRDRRERRLRLEDRAANLARDARAHLVDEVRDDYAAAVRDLDPSVADPFDADPVLAALAVLRVARTRAPVVLAVDRFADPAAAARWLDAPVVRL